MRSGAPAFPVLLALLAALCLPLAGSAAVDDAAIDFAEVSRQRKARAAIYPVRPRISRYLGAAAEKVDEGNPQEAQELLDRLAPDRLNPQERAMVYRMKAFVAYGSGDYPAAIEYFEKTIAEEILPLRAENKVRFNVAQLYATLQQWQESIDAIHRWFRWTEEPLPLAYYLLGIAHFQLDQLDLAIENAEKAIDLSPDPAEGWIQLLAALYIQNEDYESAAPVLEELVIRFPKKAYWVQLSLIYGAREDYRRSLAAQQVAYLQGYLEEEKELLRLARGYLFNDLPYDAAKVMEKGLADGSIDGSPETYELLANSWIQAREYERSIPPLERAAEIASDGNLYVRLAQVYMQREEWASAVELLQKAQEKGGLDDPGRAQLLVGICYYNDQRVGPARASFVRARRFDEVRTEADRWIQHIEREAMAG